MTDDAGDPVRYATVLKRGAWILAFETSGPEGSVALGRGGEVVIGSTLGAPREHAGKLLPTVDRLLDREGISIGDVGGVVVGAGPGSFTGVRVAAATAKGLWHGLGIPVWPVSSLVAAVCDPSALWAGPERAVLFDARGDRVYAAAYRVGSDSIEEIVAPFAADLDEARTRIADAYAPTAPSFGGSGAWRHDQRIAGAGFRVERSPVGRASAAGLLTALHLDPATEANENPAQWEPAYLRASSAERSRRAADIFDSGS